MNEKFNIREIITHLEHCKEKEENKICRVCDFLNTIIENMKTTVTREIYLYTSSREPYCR